MSIFTAAQKAISTAVTDVLHPAEQAAAAELQKLGGALAPAVNAATASTQAKITQQIWIGVGVVFLAVVAVIFIVRRK